jgi:hypothetical protein
VPIAGANHGILIERHIMLTLLHRVGLPVAAMSLLISLAGCVVYPVGGGGGYYGHPHYHPYYGGHYYH